MRGIIGKKSFNVSNDSKDDEKSSPRWCCKRRRKRWLPIMFCAVCFTFLICWVLSDIYRNRIPFLEETDANETEEAVEFEFGTDYDGKMQLLGSTEEKYCELDSECHVVCKCLDPEKISEEIDKLLTENSTEEPCAEIWLTLEKLILPERKLVRGWISLSEGISVHQLEIKNSAITEIQPETFDTGCLHELSILTLEELQVTRLEANVFLGLRKLSELNLKKLDLQIVDPFVLAPVKFSLMTLLVESSLDGVNPRPFTGSSTVDNLEIVSFEFNIFDNVISDDAFSMVPKLSSLYLRNSHISKLTKAMVDSIARSVKQIHLNGNELSTIEPGSLSNLMNKQGVKLFLEGNPWECNCSLSYLQEMMRERYSMFDEPRCAKPADLTGFLIIGVRLCEDEDTTVDTTFAEPTDEATTEELNTEESTTDETTTDNLTTDESTTDESTTDTDSPNHTEPSLPSTRPTGAPSPKPPTTPVFPTNTPTSPNFPSTNPPTLPPATSKPSTTTNAPANIISMQCLAAAVTLQDNMTAVYQQNDFTVLRRSKTFTVIESQEGIVEIVLDKSYLHMVVLWFYDTASSNSIFATNIEDSANCADIYGRVIRITSLLPDKTYLFCVIYQTEVAVSPFDCLPHKLQPTSGRRTWLVEDDKITVISILIGSVVLAIMTGLVLMYCFIKSFTSYKQAHRQIITDLHRIDQSTTNHSYMSPVVDPMNKSRRYRLKRNVSDTSLDSGRSYVSAIAPPDHYVPWKLENRSRPQVDFYPQDPSPPPLPPHPSKRYSTKPMYL